MFARLTTLEFQGQEGGRKGGRGLREGRAGRQHGAPTHTSGPKGVGEGGIDVEKLTGHLLPPARSRPKELPSAHHVRPPHMTLTREWEPGCM